MSRVCLQCEIVAFSEHILILFPYIMTPKQEDFIIDFSFLGAGRYRLNKTTGISKYHIKHTNIKFFPKSNIKNVT